MPDEQAIDVLNRLLEAEFASLVPRLGEANPFVSWPEAEGRTVIERLVADSEAHRGDLAGMILRLRGAPVSPRRSMTWGSVHYMKLAHLVPDIVAAVRELIEAYESAGPTGNEGAAALVAGILADHKRQLAELEKLHANMAQPSERP
ncbi:MAG: hypothetical protein JXQ75_18890 [Phycisphaerae bacterium]|nr:hypothetical protein [Phycisphaerae bacterium]